MGKKRKNRKKIRKPSRQSSNRKGHYSPFEIFMAVLGAAILIFVAVLIINAVFGS